MISTSIPAADINHIRFFFPPPNQLGINFSKFSVRLELGFSANDSPRLRVQIGYVLSDSKPSYSKYLRPVAGKVVTSSWIQFIHIELIPLLSLKSVIPVSGGDRESSRDKVHCPIPRLANLHPPLRQPLSTLSLGLLKSGFPSASRAREGLGESSDRTTRRIQRVDSLRSYMQ